MKKGLSVISLLLIIIGALNWGLWVFFQFDLVAWLFHGNATWPARFIYAIIGLAGIWSLRFLGRCGSICASKCDCCGKGPCECWKKGHCHCGKESCPYCGKKEGKGPSSYEK
jgi:hypothetical protein